MRSFLIIAALLVCGCDPYFDIRHPVYMVTENSFWIGCDKDPKGYKACQEFRVSQIYAGINQWFNYFVGNNLPRVVIVFSKNDLPSKLVNEVIYLKIEKGNCGKENAACYGRDNPLSLLYIVFDDVQWVLERFMAHEFGHLLGRDDNDVPKNVESIMSYKFQKRVTPLDLKKTCALHPECKLKPK